MFTSRKKTRNGLTIFVIGMFMVALAGFSATPTRAAGQTVVTIQFDDGVADQYTARPILSAHGMHATFFVNSGVIGDSAHMTWAQLGDLYGDGNEIAGHTITDANLKHMKTAPARRAVSVDRASLRN